MDVFFRLGRFCRDSARTDGRFRFSTFLPCSQSDQQREPPLSRRATTILCLLNQDLAGDQVKVLFLFQRPTQKQHLAPEDLSHICIEDGGLVGAGCLCAVSGPQHQDVGHRAEAGQVLNRLQHERCTVSAGFIHNAKIRSGSWELAGVDPCGVCHRTSMRMLPWPDTCLQWRCAQATLQTKHHGWAHLVGGAVLTQADGVVCHDEDDTRLRQR